MWNIYGRLVFQYRLEERILREKKCIAAEVVFSHCNLGISDEARGV